MDNQDIAPEFFPLRDNIFLANLQPTQLGILSQDRRWKWDQITTFLEMLWLLQKKMVFFPVAKRNFKHIIEQSRERCPLSRPHSEFKTQLG